MFCDVIRPTVRDATTTDANNMKKAYLVVYNLVSLVVWTYIFATTLKGALDGESVASIWTRVGSVLVVIQTSMLLEVLHAMVGLVRSPVITTFIQVASRVTLMYFFTLPFPTNQTHWSLVLLLLSWSAAELPRYSFYTLVLLRGSNGVPFPLFWLRYSAFIILYPCGITGEMLQCYNSLPTSAVKFPMFHRLTMLLFVLYVFAGPFMIHNMWRNRVRSFRKRAALEKGTALHGVVWPVTNLVTGERSTTHTNRLIWSASLAQVDHEAAKRASECRNWRFGYAKHVLENVRVSALKPENALAVAHAGLDAAHKAFQFVHEGRSLSLAEAMELPGSFHTGIIEGKGAVPADFSLSIPYGAQGFGKTYTTWKSRKNTRLEGEALKQQVQRWLEFGGIEASTAAALQACVDHPNWFDLRGKVFVLLGATSAMGPLEVLLDHGATVVAVDINRPRVWQRLIERARASCGQLIFPLRTDKPQELFSDDEIAEVAGANLLEEAPQICRWVSRVVPDKRLTIGNYTYLDGALHVQLSVACDAIIAGVCKKRPNTAIAFLCTPTDVHVIPPEAHAAAGANHATSPSWYRLIHRFFRNMMKRNTEPPVVTADGSALHLVDGLTVAQGPNYALAKRLQHWRAMVAHEQGHVVSSNVAPSTATASVVHAPMFAAAFGGFHHFHPLEVLFQEASSSLMCALLVHDLNAGRQEYTNALQLFTHGSFHGGIWRCGFKVGSVGEIAVVRFFWSKFKFHAAAGVAVAAMLAKWVITGKICCSHQ